MHRIRWIQWMLTGEIGSIHAVLGAADNPRNAHNTSKWCKWCVLPQLPLPCALVPVSRLPLTATCLLLSYWLPDTLAASDWLAAQHRRLNHSLPCIVCASDHQPSVGEWLEPNEGHIARSLIQILRSQERSRQQNLQGRWSHKSFQVEGEEGCVRESVQLKSKVFPDSYHTIYRYTILLCFSEPECICQNQLKLRPKMWNQDFILYILFIWGFVEKYTNSNSPRF